MLFIRTLWSDTPIMINDVKLDLETNLCDNRFPPRLSQTKLTVVALCAPLLLPQYFCLRCCFSKNTDTTCEIEGKPCLKSQNGAISAKTYIMSRGRAGVFYKQCDWSSNQKGFSYCTQKQTWHKFYPRNLSAQIWSRSEWKQSWRLWTIWGAGCSHIWPFLCRTGVIFQVVTIPLDSKGALAQELLKQGGEERMLPGHTQQVVSNL